MFFSLQASLSFMLMFLYLDIRGQLWKEAQCSRNIWLNESESYDIK